MRKFVGVLVNPESAATGAQQVAPINDAAIMLGLDLAVGQASSAETIPNAIDRLIARRITALMVVGDAVFFAQRKLIVERANAIDYLPYIPNESLQRQVDCSPMARIYPRIFAAPRAMSHAF